MNIRKISRRIMVPFCFLYKIKWMWTFFVVLVAIAGCFFVYKYSYDLMSILDIDYKKEEGIESYGDRVTKSMLSGLIVLVVLLVSFVLIFAIPSMWHDKLRKFQETNSINFNTLFVGIAFLVTGCAFFLQYVSTKQNVKLADQQIRQNTETINNEIIEKEKDREQSRIMAQEEIKEKFMDRFLNLYKDYQFLTREHGGTTFFKKNCEKLESINILVNEQRSRCVNIADKIDAIRDEVKDSMQPFLTAFFQSISLLKDKNPEAKKEWLQFVDRGMSKEEKIMLYWESHVSGNFVDTCDWIMENGFFNEAKEFFKREENLVDIIKLQKNTKNENVPNYEKEAVILEEKGIDQLKYEFEASHLYGCVLGDQACLNTDKDHHCVIKNDPQNKSSISYKRTVSNINISNRIDEFRKEEEKKGDDEFYKKRQIIYNKYWKDYVENSVELKKTYEIIRSIEKEISSNKDDTKKTQEKSFKFNELKREIELLVESKYSWELDLIASEAIVKNYVESAGNTDSLREHDDRIHIECAEKRLNALNLLKKHWTNVLNNHYCYAINHICFHGRLDEKEQCIYYAKRIKDTKREIKDLRMYGWKEKDALQKPEQRRMKIFVISKQNSENIGNYIEN